MNKLLRKVNGPYGTNCYLLLKEKGVSLIDAPFPASKLIDEIKKYGELENIFLTHAHFDHTLALPSLLKEWPNAKVFLSEEDFYYFEDHGVHTKEQLMGFDPFFLSRYGEDIASLPQKVELIKDGDEINGLQVIATPGHTKGSVCYYDKEDGVLFSGDTLFYNSVGRVDLGGDEKALLLSLKKLMLLPSSTVVLPGHGGETTIEEELNNNPYIRN